MDQNGVGRLIEIDSQGLSDGREITFLEPHRMPGIDQVRYKMRPAGGNVWYLNLQAVSFESGISKIETMEQHNKIVVCVSYGGNAVFGNVSDPDSFEELEIGMCVFLEKVNDIIVGVGDLSIAKIRKDTTVSYYDHEIGYSNSISINGSGNLEIQDDNPVLGGIHEYDILSFWEIREI